MLEKVVGQVICINNTFPASVLSYAVSSEFSTLFSVGEKYNYSRIDALKYTITIELNNATYKRFRIPITYQLFKMCFIDIQEHREKILNQILC